jgi:hypothetical protein
MNGAATSDDPQDRASLLDLLDRVANKGVVITGDVTISVADVDLIYLTLRLLLTSVETALESGTMPVRPQGESSKLRVVHDRRRVPQ